MKKSHGTRRLALTLAGFLALAVLALVYGAGVPTLALLAGLGSVLVGVNTVTYETPVAGVTAPTAAQSRSHQVVTAVITGDGAATSFTVTHNWALSAAQLAKGFPFVQLEYLLAAGYTAACLIGSKSTNAVAFTNTAFTGAGVRVVLQRPWSPLT